MAESWSHCFALLAQQEDSVPERGVAQACPASAAPVCVGFATYIVGDWCTPHNQAKMFADFTVNIRKALGFLATFDPPFMARVKHALEIGCYQGTTTNLLCDTFTKSSNVFESITCMDPWDDDYRELGNVPWHPNWNGQYQMFIKNTSRISALVNVRRGQSQQLLKEMPCEPTFDFVYVDGDHTEEGTWQDAINALPRTCKGGYILFDDYLWGEYEKQPELTPKRAVDRFVAEFKDSVEVVYQDFQLMVRVK
jgi:hypothetical protein